MAAVTVRSGSPASDLLLAAGGATVGAGGKSRALARLSTVAAGEICRGTGGRSLTSLANVPASGWHAGQALLTTG